MHACKSLVLVTGTLLLGVVATTSAQAKLAANGESLNGENINGVSRSGFVAPSKTTLGAKVVSVTLPPTKVR